LTQIKVREDDQRVVLDYFRVFFYSYTSKSLEAENYNRYITRA